MIKDFKVVFKTTFRHKTFIIQLSFIFNFLISRRVYVIIRIWIHIKCTVLSYRVKNGFRHRRIHFSNSLSVLSFKRTHDNNFSIFSSYHRVRRHFCNNVVWPIAHFIVLYLNQKRKLYSRTRSSGWRDREIKTASFITITYFDDNIVVMKTNAVKIGSRILIVAKTEYFQAWSDDGVCFPTEIGTTSKIIIIILLLCGSHRDIPSHYKCYYCFDEPVPIPNSGWEILLLLLLASL